MSSPDRREFLKQSLAGVAALGIGLPLGAQEPVAPVDPNGTIRVPGKVDQRRLGKTGVEVSVLGLGLGSVFLRNWDEEKGERVLGEALDLGINYFDTATEYKTQPLLGPFVARNRDRIFLISKSNKRDYDGFMRDFENALKELQTDHIDLFHIHALQPKDGELVQQAEPDCLRAVRKLKEEKAIRFYGLTGHSGAGILMDAMRAWDPDVVMTVITSLRNAQNDEGRYVSELLPLARERGIGVVAMKAVRRFTEGVQGPQLVRYPLSLPGVNVANIGLDLNMLDMHRSNIEVATNFAPMTEQEQAQLLKQAQLVLAGTQAPWLAPGYCDGQLS